MTLLKKIVVRPASRRQADILAEPAPCFFLRPGGNSTHRHLTSLRPRPCLLKKKNNKEPQYGKTPEKPHRCTSGEAGIPANPARRTPRPPWPTKRLREAGWGRKAKRGLSGGVVDGFFPSRCSLKKGAPRKKGCRGKKTRRGKPHARRLTASFPPCFLFEDPTDFDSSGYCLFPIPFGVLGVLAVHSFMAPLG